MFACLKTSGIAYFLRDYYFALNPVFSTWFYLALPVSVLSGAWRFKHIVYQEWTGFQSRRTFLNGLTNLQDASDEQLDNLQDVCSICFSEMQNGKVLQCSHIFHYGCLRKWFQVKIKTAQFATKRLFVFELLSTVN